MSRFSPKVLSGLPLRLNTACVLALRALVIEPDAESPSVINMAVDSLSSFFSSVRCMRQSRNLRLCKLAFLAFSRACFCIPLIALRSLSESFILALIA